MSLQQDITSARREAADQLKAILRDAADGVLKQTTDRDHATVSRMLEITVETDRASILAAALNDLAEDLA